MPDFSDMTSKYICLESQEPTFTIFEMCAGMCRGFPHSSVDKESACNAGDQGSIPGLGRSPGEGNGNSSILAWRIPQTEKPSRL